MAHSFGGSVNQHRTEAEEMSPSWEAIAHSPPRRTARVNLFLQLAPYSKQSGLIDERKMVSSFSEAIGQLLSDRSPQITTTPNALKPHSRLIADGKDGPVLGGDRLISTETDHRR
jgi:hypothetical protein